MQFDVIKLASSQLALRRAEILAASGSCLRPVINGDQISVEVPGLQGQIHRPVLHLKQGSYSCNCTFFPKPCWHILALALCWNTAPEGLFKISDADLGAENTFSISPTQQHSNIDKAAAKQARVSARWEKAHQGKADLLQWLEDVARRGVASMLAPGWTDGIAARAADASLTGVSRQLRLLGQTRENWAPQVIEKLAEIHLALGALEQMDRLPPELEADIGQYFGIPVKKDAVMAESAQCSDQWLVMGTLTEAVEEKLWVRRTWLLGAKSGKYALISDYAWNEWSFLPGYKEGEWVSGAVVYYPSAYPQRCLAVSLLGSAPQKNPSGLEKIEQLLDQWSEALSRNPFIAYLPVNLKAVGLRKIGTAWFVLDGVGQLLPVSVDENSGWALTAVYGGKPFWIFGEWNGFLCRILHHFP